MSINWEKYYTPVNQLHVTWEDNREVFTSGSINTNVYDYKPSVYGNISSSSVVTSYNLRITYDGPLNIGERLIRQERMPNYWLHSKVQAEATANTGIDAESGCCTKPYSSFWMDCMTVLSHLVCLCACCIICVQSPYMKSRKKKYNAEVDRLASDYMSREIAKLVEEADKAVTPRLQLAQQPIVTENVQLTQEQFKLLLAATNQAQNGVDIASMCQSQGQPINYHPLFTTHQPQPILAMPTQALQRSNEVPRRQAAAG